MISVLNANASFLSYIFKTGKSYAMVYIFWRDQPRPLPDAGAFPLDFF